MAIFLYLRSSSFLRTSFTFFRVISRENSSSYLDLMSAAFSIVIPYSSISSTKAAISWSCSSCRYSQAKSSATSLGYFLALLTILEILEQVTLCSFAKSYWFSRCFITRKAISSISLVEMGAFLLHFFQRPIGVSSLTWSSRCCNLIFLVLW